MKQINLRLPDNLRKDAEMYVKLHGFKNIQELAKEAIREKVIKKNYDESFTAKEIGLIDKIIDMSISKKRLVSEKELMKALE